MLDCERNRQNETMKSFERRIQVAKAIRKELALIIQSGGVKDDRLPDFVSIIDVDINPSLSSAKVIYSVWDADDPANTSLLKQSSTQAALDDQARHLRGIVGRKLNLKHAPRLVFVRSDCLGNSVDMVHLIDETVKHDDEVINARTKEQ